MDASPPQPQLNHNHYQHAPDGGIWPNGPVQLARGRQPRDANAKTVSYDVSTLDEFETRLREYLHNPPDEPEHTECQLSFWIGTSFLVSAPKQQPQHRHTHPQPQHQPQQQPPPPPGQQPQLHPSAHPSQPPPPSHTAQGQPPQIRIPQAPPGYQPANGLAAQYAPPSHTYQSMADPAMGMNLPAFPQHADSNETSPISATSKKPEQKVSLSVLEALQPTADPKIKMRNQRAIAKCCVDAIQKVDGYRYSFHNCWNSREDDSFRFSYYCNDSLLNKDRAANGKGAKLGKRATKPVYDCKGVLSVKFSAKKQSLDVFYKHIPIHKTYEERAPPPRKDSKRRKFLEENDPDALLRIANRPKPPKQEFADPNAPPKQKKKKLKTDDAKPATNSIESDLRAQSLRSLLELIQVDPPAPEPAAPEQPPPPPALPAPNPEPVIQQPPPPPPPQPPQPPPRKRPRNSCDICKAKKTKCDGTRPVCKTCIDKKRQCLYSDNSVIDDRRQSLPVPLETTETVRQAQAANHELSELEKMKRELEEAKARIQELEAEKRDSTTPSQTPTMTSRPQSQPQPPAQAQRHQPPPPQAQPQPQPQAQPQSSKQQRQQAHQLQHQHQQQQQQQQQLQHQPPSQQRQQHVQHQQLSQPNQTNQHTPHVQNNQQQITYKIDSDAPQPQLQTAQQLQTPQYFTNPANHNAYGINRPIPQNTMAQNSLSPQAPPNLSQPQANHQMHTSTTGLTPTAETTNPYGRQFEWPAAYYGYQSAQQHQQDQWATARNPGVYR